MAAVHQQACLRLRMAGKLIDRRGPEDTFEILNAAEALVKEGDFPDLPAAVAAIERHHDIEPTRLEE